MLQEITLGQYYQADSIIHRMDPRFKLIATLIYLVSLFLFKNPYVYILAIVFLILCIAISKVPFRFMVSGLKPVVFLLVITVLINMFLSDGNVIYSLWRLRITDKGLENAVYMGLRLALLIIGSQIMTLTTTPNQLTDGMESVMRPLRIFKVPVHELAMMMSIALRFIPILMEETDKIMKAQLARGADFESGNILKRVKSFVPVLIPLFVSAFKRAGDLAMAMEARCYRGGDGRTKMKPLKYSIRDGIGYLFIIIYLAGNIILGIYGKYLPLGNGFFV